MHQNNPWESIYDIFALNARFIVILISKCLFVNIVYTLSDNTFFILILQGGCKNMTLTQLKYAITVAESGSMNEAAKELFISQPSLSSSIKDLETETGVQIFRRTNRGISLTPQGEEFLGYARQVVEQYELMETISTSPKLRRNSLYPCNITHLLLMHLLRWSSSSEWMNMSLQSVRRKPMRLLRM